MKPRSLLGLLAVPVLCVVACAPDQPPVTAGCASIADCPLDQVCDRSASACIPEPANRVLGAFSCALKDPKDPNPGALGTSELVAHVGDNRFALSVVIDCTLSSDPDLLEFLFTKLDVAGFSLTVDLVASTTKPGRTSIGLALGPLGANSAAMENLDNGDRYGTSASGFVDVEGDLKIGSAISGYVDITMFPTTTDDVRFGEPCPRGLADCGRVNRSVGGADFCAEFLKSSTVPTCFRSCTGNGDCVVGHGVCVSGACTKKCNGHPDCTPPTRCYEGPNEGDESGCF